VWTTVGYASGSHIDTIYNDATRYSMYVLIAVGAGLLVYLGRRLLRRRMARARDVA
jgi:membrane protein DedA with SNARE-associated domain